MHACDALYAGRAALAQHAEGADRPYAESRPLPRADGKESGVRAADRYVHALPMAMVCTRCARDAHGMVVYANGWNLSLHKSKTQQATRLCGAASVWRRLGRGWRAHGTRSVPASLTWTNSRRGSQSPGATGLERPRVVLSCVDMGTCMARHTAAEPSAARACGAGPLARGGAVHTTPCGTCAPPGPTFRHSVHNVCFLPPFLDVPTIGAPGVACQP